MPIAGVPIDDRQRLAVVYSYDVLDTSAEDTFNAIARLAAELARAPIGLVSLVDSERQWFKGQSGAEQIDIHGLTLPCSQAVLDPEGTLVVPDLGRDERFRKAGPAAGVPLRFYAGAPVLSPDGYAIGSVCVLDRRPREIDADVLENLKALARLAGMTFELCRSNSRMARLSLSDELTGLAGERALVDAVRRAIARQRRHREPFTLLYLGLDGLESINADFGPGTSDDVLREVASALTQSVREEDMPARMGEDAFAALLVGGDGAEASVVAERVRSTVEACMSARGWPVSAFVGATNFLGPPLDEMEAVSIARALMREAKRSGRNHVLCEDFLDSLDGFPPPIDRL